ncbi:MAG: argininosuccinate lyase [Acidobacteriota bacterium]|nr:argininosuccinate lyase [Blastocatellia bacterium]MDW8412704.1 argininosuccinate lyase [Acidobacteriota bacterium]
MKVLRDAFCKDLDELVAEFVSCIEDDKYLLECDIRGSLAHVAMLEHKGLITPQQAANIRSGLETILTEGLELRPEYEDVHMNVEKRLEELIGQDALLLHTARSRNDQVALDLRLYVESQRQTVRRGLKALQATLLAQAERYVDCPMPGYTHLQRAQVVSFSHVLLAFYEAFERDHNRFDITLVSPLGACASAGTSLPIEPEYTAKLLGAQVFQNSIDAVSDRDFAVDFVYACAMTATHLSQMAETLIIWCSSEFNFIKLPDEVTTGSSIMPHKKNPDCLELVRGSAGQFIGELVNLLTTLKGLPVGYNRDLQSTKPTVIRAAKKLIDMLKVCTLVVAKLTVNKEAMLAAASDKSLYAVDLVEALVRAGVPFREAHSKVAKACALGKLSEELETYGLKAEALADPARSLAAKSSHGSPSPEKIAERIAYLKKTYGDHR